MKIDKQNPDKPYKDDMFYLETGKVLPFQNKNYQVSASIGLNSSRIRPFIFLFDTGADPSLI